MRRGHSFISIPRHIPNTSFHLSTAPPPGHSHRNANLVLINMTCFALLILFIFCVYINSSHELHSDGTRFKTKGRTGKISMKYWIGNKSGILVCIGCLRKKTELDNYSTRPPQWRVIFMVGRWSLISILARLAGTFVSKTQADHCYGFVNFKVTSPTG